MQIFELTQPVNEIDWGATAKAVGNRILQAPVRALGQRVGQDLLSPEDDKTIGQQATDLERYFDAAVDMLTHNYDETTVTAQLTNKYGATKNQAMQAIESAFDYIEKEQAANPEFAKNMGKVKKPKKNKKNAAPAVPGQSGAGAFDTMAHQLGRTPAQPVAPPVAAAPIPPTPEQKRIANQKFAGAIARAQMSATPKPEPVNYGTGVGPGVKPQMTATPTVTPPTYAISKAKPSNVVQLRPPAPPTATDDVYQSLIALQYTPAQARAAIKQLPPNISTQDAIKQVLRGTAKTATDQVTAESLTWSQNFDPSATLLKKIKPL